MRTYELIEVIEYRSPSQISRKKFKTLEEAKKKMLESVMATFESLGRATIGENYAYGDNHGVQYDWHIEEKSDGFEN